MKPLHGSLAVKLLAAQLLVIVAGALTLALVALAVAPGLFHGHVRDALGLVPEDVSRHLDEAFADSVLLSLGLAVAAALVAAGAVSAFLALRIVRPVRALAAAATRIAQGGYGERVPVTGSDELAQLAASFNDMARSLDSSERRRRELLSDVAHELRTPLATLDGYLEGIGDGVVPADAGTLAVLRTETGRLVRLADDLARVSQAEERQLRLQVEPLAAATVVRTAAEAARPAFEAMGVRLDVDCDARLPTVRLDADRIGEVLANLLENALRHTPSGRGVVLEARRRNGGLELAVADEGEGLDAEHFERVFERFYRADPSRSRERGGTGIGLTIARAIVDAHGGRIRAESEGPGRGARFVVELPAVDAPLVPDRP
ncbi:MAG: ATP-binding protein [Acidimicrobiia bacterium]